MKRALWIFLSIVVLMTLLAGFFSPAVSSNLPLWLAARGAGSLSNPISPAILEGRTVKVLYFLGSSNFSEDHLVLVEVDGSEFWTNLQIGVSLREPFVENGITAYDYPEHQNSVDRYWDDEVNSAVEWPSGIWENDQDYDMGDFVDVYVPYAPTEKDLVIEGFWSQYQVGLKTMPYKGEWYFANWDESPYAMCYSMLENFPLVKEWGEEEYGQLFTLCTGEESELSSIARLWSIYGMGSGSWWAKDSYDDVDGIQYMTFISQPPNSVVLGTVTPCDEQFPDLIRGLQVKGVKPATDPFGTFFSYWEFAPSEGLNVEVGFDDSDYASSTGVVEGTYLGFIAADKFLSDEWSVTDNRPAQFGEIQLYQVQSCRQ